MTEPIVKVKTVKKLKIKVKKGDKMNKALEIIKSYIDDVVKEEEHNNYLPKKSLDLLDAVEEIESYIDKLESDKLEAYKYIDDGDVSYEMSGYEVKCSKCLRLIDIEGHNEDCIVGKANKYIKDVAELEADHKAVVETLQAYKTRSEYQAKVIIEMQKRIDELEAEKNKYKDG